MSTASPVIPYTARTYDTALPALMSLVRATNSNLVSDFTEANAGTMLLSLVAAAIDVISFGQDSAAQEVFLSTCRQLDGAIRFANSVGYVPRQATAATATLVCSPLPTSVTTLGGTVAPGQTVTVGNTPYTTSTSTAIVPGQTLASFSAVQSTPQTDTFTSTLLAYQTVTTTNTGVAQGSWTVYVGDPTNPANEWAQVDQLLLLPSASNSYQVSFSSTGQLTAMFGNGAQGAIPQSDITIVYATTEGSAGNVPVYSVSGSLQCVTSGGTVSLPVSNSTGAATGGGDAEGLQQLKLNIPAYIKSNSRVVTLDDYTSFLLTQPGVALAWADVSVASYSQNIVKCYAWASQNVSFAAYSPSTGQTSTVPYAQYVTIPPAQVNAIHDALTPKTLLTVYNRVLQPYVANVDLYLGTVTYDPRYSPLTLHGQINAAVVGVFQSGSGFSIQMSDLTDAVRSVVGVRRVNPIRAVYDYYKGAVSTGSVLFNSNCAAGDVLSINDGRVGVGYQFVTSPTNAATGYLGVAIGTSAEETLTNLVNAVNQTLAIRAYRDPTATGPTMDLVQSRVGPSFNIPIVATNAAALTVTGMQSGSYTPTLTREDRRLDQSPIPDPYPVGAYTVGSTNGYTGWAQGGVPPYLALKDIEAPAHPNRRNYFDNQYLFNNEIYYDSGVELTPTLQAINLRRLVFDLVPSRA